MSNDIKPKINPKTWPLATLAAVFFTIFAGCVHIVSQTTLSFDEYTSQIVGLWTALAIGRGLAVRDSSTEKLHPFDRFLNTFPWTWAILVFVAIVGYIGTLGASLTFSELGTKLAILGGAFGIGRGISVFKRDTTTDAVGAQETLDRHMLNDIKSGGFIENNGDETGIPGGEFVDPNSTPKAPVVVYHPDGYEEEAASIAQAVRTGEEVEGWQIVTLGQQVDPNALLASIDPIEHEESPEDVVAAANLKLAVANGEVADPTADDPEEEDDEPYDNRAAIDDVQEMADGSPGGLTSAGTQEGVVEGTEHAPTTRHTPDPEKLP